MTRPEKLVLHPSECSCSLLLFFYWTKGIGRTSDLPYEDLPKLRTLIRGIRSFERALFPMAATPNEYYVYFVYFSKQLEITNGVSESILLLS